jgi:hypothetical protein
MLSISRHYPLLTRFNTSRSLKALLANQAGLRCDHAELLIEVVAEYGNTRRLRFFFDSGAHLMVIPVFVGRHEGIRYSEEFPGTISSSVGGSARCYFDFVQVRSSLSWRTHRWVCAFVESLQARLIVGSAGFLDDFAVAVNGHRLVVSHSASLSRFLNHHAARLRAHSGVDWEPI